MKDEENAAASDAMAVRQVILGYQAARALLAADELGLTDLLTDGPKSAEQLAQVDAIMRIRLDGDVQGNQGPTAANLKVG